MKVERTGQTRGGTAKKVGKSAQNGGFVIPDVGGSDNVTDTKAVAGAQPVAPVDSLLALQEVSDQSQGRKRAVRRASSMLDVLEDIANGFGPNSALLALGYSGWGPGQLEDEILQNGWLTCQAAPEIVFGADDDGKWNAALSTLGIDARMLSGTAGRA